MNVGKKIGNYLANHGIQKTWFAKRIGISRGLLSQILIGIRDLPVTSWERAIETTDGELTLSDLMKSKFKDIDFLEVREMADSNVCKVRIKKKS